MLGMDRQCLALVPHRSVWHRLFLEESSWIRERVTDEIVGIEHIGSTAVPNLKARPIIDIALEMPTVEAVQSLVRPLVRFGYTYFGKQDAPGEGLFVKKGRNQQVFFLYASVADAGRIERYCMFRDCLRRQGELRRKYQSLKEESLKQCGENRRAYRRMKGMFVQTVEVSLNAGMALAGHGFDARLQAIVPAMAGAVKRGAVTNSARVGVKSVAKNGAKSGAGGRASGRINELANNDTMLAPVQSLSRDSTKKRRSSKQSKGQCVA